MFITIYSRKYHQIKNIINKHLPVLFGVESFFEVFKNGCRFVTRHAGTLGGISAPSVVHNNSKRETWLQTKGTYKCGSTSQNTGKGFEMNDYINCNTKSVVYLLTCRKCKLQYVGCTTRSLKCRMREHINHITSCSNTSVVICHFVECNGGDITQLDIQGIEKVKHSDRGGDFTAKLFHREAFWIFTLGTR
ncbi:hypothetical protein XELAEV_18022456mg [Xenopus laevis]|uniref:GIY-YIG domain-containing protein n=1 Tax=Xenopus laevis TaxID=8355 RepID=A0A974D535_XENLA|nr:hypothetical protein XELAEV_18022456mg [Xenopus laevis]